jgi:hypothetical protein
MKKAFLATMALGASIVFSGLGTVAYAATSGSTVTPATSSSGAVSISLTPADAKAMTSVIQQTAADLGYLGKSYVPVIPNPQNTTSPSGASVSLAQSTELLYMGSNDELDFNTVAWHDATTTSKTDALTDFVKDLQKSNVSDQGQQNVINAMEGQESSIKEMLIPIIMSGTSANLYTALRFLTPFLPVMSLILGILAFVVMLGLMISTVIDLSFIGLPIFRESIINREESKGHLRVPLISHDALSVVRETELDVGSTGGYRNVYLLYFKRRALSYILLSICVLYLVVGELGGVIGWLLHLASGSLITK